MVPRLQVHRTRSQLNLLLQHQSLILSWLVAVEVVESPVLAQVQVAVAVLVVISHLLLQYRVELVTQSQLALAVLVSQQIQPQEMEATRSLLL
jgi:hypothetical protein